MSLGLVALASGCGKKSSEPAPAATHGSGSGNGEASGGSEPAAGSADDTAAAKPAGHAGKATLVVAGTQGEYTPSKQGFKFQNYGNDEGIENLTATELQRMFGRAACSDDDQDTCVLTPAAKKWMEETNKGMNGGHCEGLASLSLLFDIGKLAPKDFGAASAYELELAGNAKLQHEVAYWFSTQFVPPMDSAEIKTLTPNQIVDKLRDAFTSGKETYTIGIYLRDGSGGHATTPYAIVDKDDHTTWIMHYDNNFPGEERHIEIDRAANTWKYFTAADPNEPGSLYDGDASTFSLTIAPTSVRTGALKCPFCGDIDPDAAATAASGGDDSKGALRQIDMEGDADLLITDDAGKKIGHDGGKLVNEIAGAKVVQVKAVTPHGNQHEPLYELPTGHALTVTLDGGALKSKEATDVSLVAPGYTMGVYGVDLSPHEQDQITFSADWREVSYTTAQDETPDLEIGIEEKGADYDFEIHASGEASGQRVDLALDPKAGTLTVASVAKDGDSTFEVIVHRIDAKGEQIYKHAGVGEHAGDRAVFHYSDWKGNGTPMAVGIDKGGDGKVDQNEELTDED